MKKYVFIIFLILITTVYAEEQYKTFGHGKVVFFEQDLTIEVEVATTEKQRTRGLMFREYLAPNKGMLFVFEQEVIQNVWMRDTLIPLDIVFISAKGKIVSIIKDLQPCVNEICDIYSSTKRAKYMLEVNQGMVDRKDISVNQMLIFKDI